MVMALLMSAAPAVAGEDAREGAFTAADMPERWLLGDTVGQWRADSVPVSSSPALDRWWECFGDPVLTALVRKAETRNADVAVALRRIEAARQSLAAARGAYFPTVSADAGWQKGAASGKQAPPYGHSSGYSYFTLGLSANWEIDLFGRVREKVKAGKASVNLSRADYASAMVSVCANMAKAYLNLRTYQEQFEVALDHIESQERVLAMTQARHEAGLASALDVAQARTLVLSTKATIPGLRALIFSSLNSISVLTGEFPGNYPPELEQHIPLPAIPDDISAGIPADILRRRPDIVAAEEQLVLLAAQMGIARKDFLPVLSIAGEIGTSARRASDLFSSHSMTWSVAPQLSWTVFDGLARNHNVAEARVNLEAGVESYNLTVLEAMQEIENDLALYAAAIEERDMYVAVADQSRRTLELAIDRYKLGLSDFTNVADAQLSLLENQNMCVEAKAKVLTAIVSLYQALGGGWVSSR